MIAPKKKQKKKTPIKKKSPYGTFNDPEIQVNFLKDFHPKDNPAFLLLFQDLDKKDKSLLTALFQSKNLEKAVNNKSIFAKKAGEISYFALEKGNIPAVMLIGLGKKGKLTPNIFTNALHTAFERSGSLGWEKIDILISPELCSAPIKKGAPSASAKKEAPSALNPEKLASWIASISQLSQYKNRVLASNQKENSKQVLKTVNLVFLSISQSKGKIEKSIDEGRILGKFVNLTREAVSLPGNHMTPGHLAKRAIEAGKKLGFSVKVLNKNQLKQMGMNGIISVGKGSIEEPKLIIMHYKGAPHRKKIDLGIAGKGITFDSGGISLKPSSDMHEMKGDMGGAAAALYGLSAITKAKLPVNILAVIGAAENIPGARAQKPGDIYTSYKGLTVEVLNTDAEGRLILADLLSYLAEHKCERIVDIATLTGACLMALGPHLAGLFSNNEKFQQLVFQAGEESLDRVWPLPLYDEYKEHIKSDIADLTNIGPRPGGAITAASFLKHFVPDDIAWAHLDIAGKFIIKKDAGLHRKGSTGFGVRILFEIAKSIISHQKNKRGSKF